jgi:hypothetical protein
VVAKVKKLELEMMIVQRTVFGIQMRKGNPQKYIQEENSGQPETSETVTERKT